MLITYLITHIPLKSYTYCHIHNNLQKPKADIQFYFVISYSTSQFSISNIFHAPLRIKQIPINNPIDEFNFLFLLLFLARAPFVGFSSYLVNAEREHHKLSFRIKRQRDVSKWVGFLILVVYSKLAIPY